VSQDTYFHVCYVVPDLEASMAELTTVLGVSWQAPRDRASGDMRWRLVYTNDGAPFIELVEGQPGSPWHAPDGPKLHHIGRFTYNLDEGIRQMEAAGGRIEVDGREISGRWAYFRVPTSGALIELIEADDERRLERYGVGPRRGEAS
jgi:catechol 2,3-dioxygenase-like lactoylglutathione lyase family enzyme